LKPFVWWCLVKCIYPCSAVNSWLTICHEINQWSIWFIIISKILVDQKSKTKTSTVWNNSSLKIGSFTHQICSVSATSIPENMHRHNERHVLGSTHGLNLLLRVTTPVEFKESLYLIQFFMIHVILHTCLLSCLPNGHYNTLISSWASRDVEKCSQF
jgi:hypothetical protein